MPLIATNCPHIDGRDDLSIIEDVINHKEAFYKCLECHFEGPNLWLCLYPKCHYVGCAKEHRDHITIHNQRHITHCAHMNLASNRIWCYICQTEIFTLHVPSSSISSSKDNLKVFSSQFSGDASISTDCKHENHDFHQCLIKKFIDESNMANRIHAERGDHFFDKLEDSPDSTDSDDSRECSRKYRGLVGLQNIGNTCYMNAALQALSNVPPLTNFFIDCGQMINHIARDRKPGLSLSYLQLVQEMWKKGVKGFIVPHTILTGIRTVHPMFRGYHQHDTQEFLRCFMDQLHEELKEPTEEKQEDILQLKGLSEPSSDEEEAEIDGNGSSQSDAEYETCDSGVSEQSSLSDEGERGMKRRYSRINQVDKLRNKFTNRCLKKGPVEVIYSQQQRSSQNSPVKRRSKKQIKMRSIISDVFDGKLLSSVQCLTCDRISTRIETFQDLSLPIPSRDHIDMLHQGSLTPQKAGTCSDVVYVTNYSGWWWSWIYHWVRSWFWGPVVNLHDCLAAFFSADELKGDNMYSCERCNKLRNGIKYSKVLELPEILCIHLKRFRHELMFSSKIASHVSFPLEGLDLRPYLHKNCISNVTTYDLISVICHHGTAGGGHYVCYAFNTSTNQWFEFDDQCVTPVSSETVKNCGAYVLFYRKSQEIFQMRNKTEELMEMSSKKSLDIKFFVSRQWINRFNNFAEPGPIDNSDFLCFHGGVNPVRTKIVDKICIPIPQIVWEFIFQTFGGGPVCTHLYECPICEEKHEAMEKRRLHELEIFNQFNRSDNSTGLYALAMCWFRLWQSFVKNKEVQPPGPIDNSSICINKGAHTVLKIGSNYGSIREELWQFFVNTYGGGPEVILHSCQRPVPTHSSILTHSGTNLAPVDQNPKFNCADAKQILVIKRTDSISMQDVSETEKATSNDTCHLPRENC